MADGIRSSPDIYTCQLMVSATSYNIEAQPEKKGQRRSQSYVLDPEDSFLVHNLLSLNGGS
jgi:hypothetical protein